LDHHKGDIIGKAYNINFNSLVIFYFWCLVSPCMICVLFFTDVCALNIFKWIQNIRLNHIFPKFFTHIYNLEKISLLCLLLSTPRVFTLLCQVYIDIPHFPFLLVSSSLLFNNICSQLLSSLLLRASIGGSPCQEGSSLPYLVAWHLGIYSKYSFFLMLRTA
jgi:hypothetical protein